MSKKEFPEFNCDFMLQPKGLILKLTLKRLSLAIASVGMLTIYGCGGGGASSTTASPTSTLLSGTVAGGAAVIGTVIVTDSKGETKGATIEADGKYTIDVAGMTGPFILKAAGTVGNTSVTYYSAATQADVGGTVNVTPFTNLIVSNIAAQIAETYFSNSNNIANIANISTLITEDSLNAAETALQAKLLPVLTALGISSSIDLLRSTFAADHSGIDAVLDLVKVEVDTVSNIVTLRNALNDLAISTDDVAIRTDDATAADTTKIEGINTGTVTDLDSVVKKLNSFGALFATRLPTETELFDSGLFVTGSNFMMSGESFAEFASNVASEPDLIGLNFSNVDIKPVVDNPDVLILTAVMSSDEASFKESLRLKMVRTANGWKVQGDGRIADIEIKAQAHRSTASYFDGTNVIQTTETLQSGINIYIDPFSYNANNANTPKIASALVTGPGLPADGVTLVPSVNDTWLQLESLNYNTNITPECSTQIVTQCVTISGTSDNGQYTVILKDADNNNLNDTGYRINLPKKPVASNTLTAAMFPSITGITINGQELSIANLVGSNSIAMNWVMPSTLKSNHTSIWFDGANKTPNFFRVEKNLKGTDTSTLFGLTGLSPEITIFSGGVWLEGRDVYGRSFATSIYREFVQ